MELWGWLVGYVLLFALLHVVLYYYYVRRENDEQPASPSLSEGSLTGVRYGTPIDDRAGSGLDEGIDDPDDYAVDLDGEIQTCRTCGAPNDADATYTYCWNCLSTLGT
ncbi:hypothetical protein Halru_0259 [Halovivax ruber XH-70]|uniref:DUF7577 domain-containing protein n=1 Tax=Halovivax ruber (strain DSM 18193 / JCM 13892 / XH-70) TaxID=797302 RepID=L0I5W0_HALRX|nr:hypothetical protein [Halovivax ruber]AGB14905.1 hypothetical protein Halru_0259 [Halovivax ruber XH-70]